MRRELASTSEYLRSTAKTVVVGDGLDAAGASHGHVTALIPEVDPDHGHRGHGCFFRCCARRYFLTHTRHGIARILTCARIPADRDCATPRVMSLRRLARPRCSEGSTEEGRFSAHGLHDARPLPTATTHCTALHSTGTTALPSAAKFASKLANHGSVVARVTRRVVRHPLWNILEASAAATGDSLRERVVEPLSHRSHYVSSNRNFEKKSNRPLLRGKCARSTSHETTHETRRPLFNYSYFLASFSCFTRDQR